MKICHSTRKLQRVMLWMDYDRTVVLPHAELKILVASVEEQERFWVRKMLKRSERSELLKKKTRERIMTATAKPFLLWTRSWCHSFDTMGVELHVVAFIEEKAKTFDKRTKLISQKLRKWSANPSRLWTQVAWPLRDHWNEIHHALGLFGTVQFCFFE